MPSPPATSLRTVIILALTLCLAALPSRADVLIGINGDRFTGKVLEETAGFVIFDCELGGKLTIPRSRIREIQRSPLPIADNRILTTNGAPVSPNGPLSTRPLAAPRPGEGGSTLNSQPSTFSWLPPAIGYDNEDWIQLKSGEWLRGHLYYIQQRKVQFDSDELDDFSLDLKDVRQVYPANPMFTKFDGRDQIYGAVVVSNDVIQVSGPEQVSLPRDQLTGITPGGKREFDFWSGSLNVALTLQSGNTRQANLSTSAELARRTPATTIDLSYLGNFGEAEGVKNANNHRVDGLYDIRLSRRWFLRPAYLEYYKDELANIAHKATVGVGLGYYIFDRNGLEWQVAGGPGYQHTKFETVEPGQSHSASTPAAVLQTTFKADITRRLKFIETINATLTSKDSGLYSHHAVSTLEFEIKRHLDLNVSFVWDYLQDPQIESSGAAPQRSDFRLNLGVGVKF